MRAREWGMQKGKEGDALLLEDEIPKEKEEIHKVFRVFPHNESQTRVSK